MARTVYVTAGHSSEFGTASKQATVEVITGSFAITVSGILHKSVSVDAVTPDATARLGVREGTQSAAYYLTADSTVPWSQRPGTRPAWLYDAS